jgi:phosphopantothenoylcysteine synthetase/decarboxylase
MPDSRRFLVTAGNTREMIDRVRDWGNIFTGNTGFAIAKSLHGIGHVDLMTSNLAHIEQAAALGMNAIAFRSHADLLSLLESSMSRTSYDAVFMTAAVADYRPAGAFAVLERTDLGDGREQWVVQSAQAGKIKSTHTHVAFLGQQTEKIIDHFRRDWAFKGTLVKFKLEVGLGKDELLAVGRASRVASSADFLIANTLDMVEGENAGAYLISEKGERFVPRHELARVCAELVK